jgi:hypothetical protein
MQIYIPYSKGDDSTHDKSMKNLGFNLEDKMNVNGFFWLRLPSKLRLIYSFDATQAAPAIEKYIIMNKHDDKVMTVFFDKKKQEASIRATSQKMRYSSP